MTNELILKLLAQRGITSGDDVREYLSPRPRRTYDPMLMKGMKDAVDVIEKAVRNGSRICIYGDYDSDGITSVTIMMQTLRRITDRVLYYIPSRFDEGYGLNTGALDRLASVGVDLIITVDNGCVAYKEVEYARSLGMDVIVTDHHNIDDRKADCILIDPKQEDCDYPFKYLAGCGVAFKLVQALRDRFGLPKSVTSEVLDLTGIGTIGDIVPLTDENRTLAKYGIIAVNTSRRPGLVKLIDAVGLQQGKISSENVAFAIVPYLNAAGRIKHASLAVEVLLAAEDDPELDEKVRELVACNTKRKNLQEDSFRKCLDIIDQTMQGRNFLLVRCDDVHEGIAGIVAGKIKDEFNKPTVILTPSDRGFKGTGRSIEGVDIYELLHKYGHMFNKFGGHKGACGFHLKPEYLEALSDGLEKDMLTLLEEQPDILEHKVRFDLEADPADIDLQLAEDLSAMEPFGCDNERPLFCFSDPETDYCSYMGEGRKHMRFSLRSGDGRNIKCLLFNQAEKYYPVISSGEASRIVGSIGINEWHGSRSVEIRVENVE